LFDNSRLKNKFQIDAATWAANEKLFKQTLESYGAYKELYNQDSFYVVPFEQATDLVAHRKVLLRGGKAFVHKNDIISIVLAQFRYVYLSDPASVNEVDLLSNESSSKAVV
jgi:hypothetical protein